MAPEPRKIPFDDAHKVSQHALRDILKWLKAIPQTVDIKIVEDDPVYREIDVDLLWTTQRRQYQVEIKGDQWHQTGNFFLETQSNKEKQTPGCFLYTQADLVFYYFIEPSILYILPMPLTRKWFQNNLRRFEERSTTTPVGNAQLYTTVGRLVPINTLLEEIPTVRRVALTPA